MTEAEWLACDDPVRLLAHLHRLPGDRRLLLYAVACRRAHWRLLTHPAGREAVAWAERFADGEGQRDEEYERSEYASEGAAFGLDAAGRAERLADWAADAGDERCTSLRRLSGRIREGEPPSRATAAYFANALMTLDTCDPFDPTLHLHRSLLLAPHLRDIFGNPFRPVTFSPEWRTDTAVALARQMYASRDFSAMPILADALQDAGCDNGDILDHCRDASAPHVRGCWVADLVLGKE